MALERCTQRLIQAPAEPSPKGRPGTPSPSHSRSAPRPERRGVGSEPWSVGRAAQPEGRGVIRGAVARASHPVVPKADEVATVAVATMNLPAVPKEGRPGTEAVEPPARRPRRAGWPSAPFGPVTRRPSPKRRSPQRPLALRSVRPSCLGRVLPESPPTVVRRPPVAGGGARAMRLRGGPDDTELGGLSRHRERWIATNPRGGSQLDAAGSVPPK